MKVAHPRAVGNTRGWAGSETVPGMVSELMTSACADAARKCFQVGVTGDEDCCQCLLEVGRGERSSKDGHVGRRVVFDDHLVDLFPEPGQEIVTALVDERALGYRVHAVGLLQDEPNSTDEDRLGLLGTFRVVEVALVFVLHTVERCSQVLPLPPHAVEHGDQVGELLFVQHDAGTKSCSLGCQRCPPNGCDTLDRQTGSEKDGPQHNPEEVPKASLP